MIECPLCHSETMVVRTDGAERRRECTKCFHRFTTVEQDKELWMRVQKALARMKEAASSVLGI